MVAYLVYLSGGTSSNAVMKTTMPSKNPLIPATGFQVSAVYSIFPAKFPRSAKSLALGSDKAKMVVQDSEALHFHALKVISAKILPLAKSVLLGSGSIPPAKAATQGHVVPAVKNSFDNSNVTIGSIEYVSLRKTLEKLQVEIGIVEGVEWLVEYSLEDSLDLGIAKDSGSAQASLEVFNSPHSLEKSAPLVMETDLVG